MLLRASTPRTYIRQDIHQTGHTSDRTDIRQDRHQAGQTSGRTDTNIAQTSEKYDKGKQKYGQTDA